MSYYNNRPPTGNWLLPPQPQYRPPVQHVSGLTTGQHIMFGILTFFTCGLLAPLWIAAAFLNRRRVS